MQNNRETKSVSRAVIKARYFIFYLTDYPYHSYNISAALEQFVELEYFVYIEKLNRTYVQIEQLQATWKYCIAVFTFNSRLDDLPRIARVERHYLSA